MEGGRQGENPHSEAGTASLLGTLDTPSPSFSLLWHASVDSRALLSSVGLVHH